MENNNISPINSRVIKDFITEQIVILEAENAVIVEQGNESNSIEIAISKAHNIGQLAMLKTLSRFMLDKMGIKSE